MSDAQAQVERIIDAYRAAVLAADADALMRLYHADVRVFDTWGVWMYEGAAAWRRAVEGWFTSLGHDRVRVRFSDVQVEPGQPIVTVSAIVAYAAESSGGEALRSMENRITWVLRESGHVLRIVHEHTSAPVGFEDSKAILARAPQPGTR